MMKVGIFAKTFPGDTPAGVLAACHAAGFASVQYNMACSGLGSLPEVISEDSARQVADAAARTGIQLAAISATYNMTDPDARRRHSGRHAFAAIAGRAAEMGTTMLSVCSGSMDPHDRWRHHPANDEPQSWAEMCREFEIICDIAERHDIFVGVEPEVANIVSSAAKAAQLLAEFPGSRLRIILDPANILEDVPPDQHRRTIDAALDLLGPAIALAHAKDRHDDGSVAPAGAGIVDWSHFLCGLSGIGFEGPLIAHGMTAGEAPAVATFLTDRIAGL
jgi:sugar phosphate isomerase/epimerase